MVKQTEAAQRRESVSAAIAAVLDLAGGGEEVDVDATSELFADIVSDQGGSPDELMEIGMRLSIAAYELATNGNDSGEGDDDSGEGDDDSGEGDNPNWEAAEEAKPPRRRRRQPATKPTSGTRRRIDDATRKQVAKAIKKGELSQAKIAEKYEVSRGFVQRLSATL